MTITAFWTFGCKFEGQQSALAEAWFVMYPAIAHFMLIYYSSLNSLAKLFRRRVSDVLFTPSVILLCLLHYFRLELAESGWLKGVDGRVITQVFSDEVEQLELVDYFRTDIAWRMGGCVTLIFVLKLVILALNLLPLLVTRSFPIRSSSSELALHGVEKALMLRVECVGGLSNSRPYLHTVIRGQSSRVLSTKSIAAIPRSTDTGELQSCNHEFSTTIIPFPPGGHGPELDKVRREHVFVCGYELIRLGYVVFGDKYLTTFHEWGLLSAMVPFRGFYHLWNHRVLVWTLGPVHTNGDAEIAGGRTLENTKPQLWRLDDPRLKEVRWGQVSTCNLQC